MDEVEYKLNTKNSVLIVNAIDKLINTIKLKYKPEERQKFVLENEELKFLREKCSSKDGTVSLTACQGLLALVELGVLEIAHTMSTVVTLIPSAHNYSAIISTMAGLLILDLKSRLVPGQPYKCQFSLKSPQHPFITVLERNKDTENDILTQMHALCTHPDYTVSSNSLELLRPVFLWLTCNPLRCGSSRPWQLLLSLPQTSAQTSLLLACISCQQICNSSVCERAFSAYSAVTEAAVYQQRRERVTAFLPVLARVAAELLRAGRDPRPCYCLIDRCFSLDAPELRTVAGLTIFLLAENLTTTTALYLHELFNLCFNIITRYECSAISINTFAALSLQWLHLPSYLTSSALKVASKIVDVYQSETKDDTRLHMPNLKANKVFQSLLYTDSHLSVTFKLHQTWERLRDDPDKLITWFDSIQCIDDMLKLELVPFLIGVTMVKKKDAWFEEIKLKALNIIIQLVDVKKDLSVQVLPILLYKIANDVSPRVKMECLSALPLMAKTKENVPAIVSILNKLKTGKGVPYSYLIMLYTNLAETQVRCFPYLQELLAETGPGRPDDLKWELDIARAVAVRRICELRASSHGVELVSVISSILNRCSDKAGALATSQALQALGALWRAAAVAPPSTWRALEPKLGRDGRPIVQASLCKLLSEVPALRVSSPEYDRLVRDAARKLWLYVAESNHPAVAEAACDALAEFNIDDYKLKDIPEVYRKLVQLPPSYCKTPADAARKPEDVLDYVPCEVWPCVFKYTNQSALSGVQRLASKLIEREVRSYRSGVYQLDARGEPQNLTNLPAHSVVLGLVKCFKKQATNPTYDFPESVLLSILETLTSEYPKPLPPLDLSFLHELFHRGSLWRVGCVKLAARQAQISLSARRFLENYLEGIQPEVTEESDVILIFELLPTLCRGTPPNALRGPIEACLGHSFAAIAKYKAKDTKEDHIQDHLFIRQLEMIEQCLESDKIHDANRTLLSQIVEHYFNVINDDNVAWPTYVRTCRCLSTKYLERMTSPTGWWEVTSEALRKAVSVRAAVAAAGDCAAPLVWLNEVIDAQADSVAEQEYSLRCMLPALQAAKPDEQSTKDWFLQLMARTQVALTESSNESAKLYLCDVFFLSVVVFSGHCSLEPGAERALTAGRSARAELMPAAAAALLARPAWADTVLQVLEWLVHTRDALGDDGAALCCQRALLALRHTDQFATHKIWIKLERFFGRTINGED